MSNLYVEHKHKVTYIIIDLGVGSDYDDVEGMLRIAKFKNVIQSYTIDKCNNGFTLLITVVRNDRDASVIVMASNSEVLNLVERIKNQDTTIQYPGG